MNCTQAQDRFAELLDRRQETAASGDVRTHLAACPDCQREFAALQRTLSALDALPAPAPGPRVRANFYAMLEEEKNSAASVRLAEHRRRRLTVWRWILSPVAACGLLALGFLAGQHTAPVPAPAATEDDASRRELAELRQRVDTMGQLVGYSLQQQRLGSQRLQGILATHALNAPDQQVITQLINTLALDPSTNVRLTALEALYPYADQEVVRAGVLASLVRESNPLVQVSMIDFLTAAQDPEAAATFENLANDEQIDRAVRDAARRALVQL
jgi:predicted anti-sigma-YlaC factor YlaD